MRWIKIVFLAFFFGIFGGIFADQILWPYFVERPLFLKYRLEIPKSYVVEKEITIQENTALKEAIEKVQKSSFFVKTQMKGKEITGSGFILTPDGLAITLADLVPWGGKFSFWVEGKPVHFQILKRDLKQNLALIKFEGKNFATRGFANFEKLKLGERVFLVANFKEEKGIEVLVDEGVVKSFNQNLVETNFKKDERILGSPLFNIEGEFLGLNFVKDQKVFVIPVTKIREFSGL
jgi:S1-C subfamily serine protease